MKIKYKILFFLFISILFTSCDNSIKCDGFEEKETVKQILKEDILKNSAGLIVFGGIDKEYINTFFDKNVKLDLIRTKAINKELKSCECAAKLTFILNPEITKNIKSNFLTSSLFEGIDIEYNLQMTNDDNFIAETHLLTEKLTSIIMIYGGLENNHNSKELVIEEDEQNSKDLFIEEDNNKTYFKINVSDLRVRSNPNLDSDKIENLAIDTEVEFIEKSNNQATVTIKNDEITEYWYKVKTPSGKIGWIHGCCFDK